MSATVRSELHMVKSYIDHPVMQRYSNKDVLWNAASFENNIFHRQLSFSVREKTLCDGGVSWRNGVGPTSSTRWAKWLATIYSCECTFLSLRLKGGQRARRLGLPSNRCALLFTCSEYSAASASLSAWTLNTRLIISKLCPNQINQNHL